MGWSVRRWSPSAETEARSHTRSRRVNLVARRQSRSRSAPDAEPFAPLTEPRQSASPLVDGTGRKTSVYLLGGIGPDGDVSRTLGDVWRLNVDSGQWTKLSTVIADCRGMFRCDDSQERHLGFRRQHLGPATGPLDRRNARRRFALGLDRRRLAFVAAGKQLPRQRRSFAAAVLDQEVLSRRRAWATI